MQIIVFNVHFTWDQTFGIWDWNLLAGDLISGDLCKTAYFITKCVNFITLINRKGTREEEVEDILVVNTAVK